MVESFAEDDVLMDWLLVRIIVISLCVTSHVNEMFAIAVSIPGMRTCR